MKNMFLYEGIVVWGKNLIYLKVGVKTKSLRLTEETMCTPPASQQCIVWPFVLIKKMGMDMLMLHLKSKPAVSRYLHEW